jgi:hypothetical protein
LFAAIGKFARSSLKLAGYAASASMIYFAVTGVAFPFIYGAHELMASIARFAIAYLSFLAAAGLEAIICTSPAGLDCDVALIDDNETRLGAADGGSAVDAALAHARDQQLAFWVNRNRG